MPFKMQVIKISVDPFNQCHSRMDGRGRVPIFASFNLIYEQINYYY